ncbi:MAG TPA: DUF5678 domain-containing protein [Thermoanaerobaculia bacterium]|nr:DUF5678 domain-containing protein [Thermoanaerobaculia bacterium]
MGKAFKIAPTDESTVYVPRIRALVESGRVHEARELVSEALYTNPSEPGLAQWSEVLSPAATRAVPELDVGRSADFRWLEAHADSYQDQWVAVLRGSLVAHASTLRELEAILDETASGAPVLLHRFH